MKRFKELIRDFKTGNLSRAYIFSTDDSGISLFLVKELKSAISSKYGVPEVIRKDLLESALNEAGNFSLIMKPRMILSEVTGEEISILKTRRIDVPDRTFLVLFTGLESASLLEGIKGVECYVFKKIPPDEMKKIIEEYISSSGYRINPEALEILMSSYTGNFGEIMNEVEKLILYTGEKREIEKPDVLGCVFGITQKFEEEELFFAIMNGDIKKALAILSSFRSAGRKNEKIWMLVFGTLVSRLKLLLQIKEKLQKGAMERSPYFMLAKKYKYQTIYRILDILREHDISIKYGYLPRYLLFEKLTLSIFKELGFLK